MVLEERYQLGAVIGTGGMSDVYAATDTVLGREVAVKMMRPDLARDVNSKERFRREAQNYGQLNHPSIVAVYDTGEAEINGVSVPYIVMEHIHGRTLRDIIREDGPMPIAQAAQFLAPVCDALQFSHAAGIIHRDIKPANIMVTNTGSVKVMDFGIARAVGDSSAMTQTAAVIGTAQYLSPEQARGKGVTPGSDVYALGCVMYELVTGRPPFQAEDSFSVAYAHVHEAPEPPSDFIPDLTPTAAVNIDAVVLTAMAKAPEDRYASAAEFGEDLRRISRGALAHAARTHVHRQPADQAGAHAPAGGDSPTQVVPAVSGAHSAAAGPAPAAGYSAAAAPQYQPAPPQPVAAPVSHQEPLKQQRSSRVLPVVLTTVLVLAGAGVAGYFAYDYFSGGSTVATKKTVAVPEVKGRPSQEAQNALLDSGLKVDVHEVADPQVPRGTALGTNPQAGSQLPPGSSVVLNVSSGKEVTEVPDVKGKTTKDVARLLKDAGLELDPSVKEAPDDAVPAGQVVSQTPAAGSQVSKGTQVTITVSTGVETVRVPVVAGMAWDQAEGNITSLGFVPQVQMVNSEVPEGTVVSVQREGEALPKGSTVIVKVSKGGAFAVPNLSGMVTDQAIAALRSAGWVAPNTSLVVEQVPSANLLEQGKVVSQVPAPGEVIRTDDLVTVRVNTFSLVQAP